MCLITECQNTWRKTDRTAKRTRWICYYIWRVQHSPISRRQIQQGKISKNVAELNRTINQLDLIDIYRTLHQATAEYTFFSSSHGTFTKIDHILGDKTHLNKFKTLDIIHSVFSDHSRIKLQINNRKIAGKSQNIWRLNNTLLNNTWVQKKSQEKFF